MKIKMDCLETKNGQEVLRGTWTTCETLRSDCVVTGSDRSDRVTAK